jgi:hypothetical protein
MGGCTALGIGLLLVARLGRTLQYVAMSCGYSTFEDKYTVPLE